jgi:hypothetical protein
MNSPAGNSTGKPIGSRYYARRAGAEASSPIANWSRPIGKIIIVAGVI